MAYSVLIVDHHPVLVARLAEPLRQAGYAVTGATSFEAAQQHLTSDPPNLLIAAARLGSFHGLHLVLRGRFDNPGMAAIITTGSDDPVLKAEAHTYGAKCVVVPRSSNELLALVTSTFASQPM